MLQSGRRRNLLQTVPSAPPPPPPSQEEQTLQQILAAVTALQTGQTSLQTDIDALQVQVDAANAAATANAQDTSLQVLLHCTPLSALSPLLLFLCIYRSIIRCLPHLKLPAICPPPPTPTGLFGAHYARCHVVA